MSPRKTEEERKAERLQAARNERYVRLRHSGMLTREDREENDFTFEPSPGLLFTITQDILPCQRCDVLIAPLISETNDGMRHRKTWACPHCRWTMHGQWTTYLIQEEPGSMDRPPPRGALTAGDEGLCAASDFGDTDKPCPKPLDPRSDDLCTRHYERSMSS